MRLVFAIPYFVARREGRCQNHYREFYGTQQINISILFQLIKIESKDQKYFILVYSIDGALTKKYVFNQVRDMSD